MVDCRLEASVLLSTPFLIIPNNKKLFCPNFPPLFNFLFFCFRSHLEDRWGLGVHSVWALDFFPPPSFCFYLCVFLGFSNSFMLSLPHLSTLSWLSSSLILAPLSSSFLGNMRAGLTPFLPLSPGRPPTHRQAIPPRTPPSAHARWGGGGIKRAKGSRRKRAREGEEWEM